MYKKLYQTLSYFLIFSSFQASVYLAKMIRAGRKKSGEVRKKSRGDPILSPDSMEKGSPEVPAPGGLAGMMGPGGIIKLAAGVADMQPKIINRQMSTASFDMNSRQYEQVKTNKCWDIL